MLFANVHAIVPLKGTSIPVRQNGKHIWRGKCASDPKLLGGRGAAGARSLRTSRKRALLPGQLVTARHFAQAIIPEAGALRRRIKAGAETLMALPAEAFGGGA